MALGYEGPMTASQTDAPPGPGWFRRLLRLLRHVGFVLLVLLGSAWTATALVIQLAGLTRVLALVALATLAGATLIFRFRNRQHAWACLAFGVALTAGWYQSIHPRDDRDWDFDVAHGVTAEIDSPVVTLHNVRDFTWTSDSTAEVVWRDMTVNLDQMTGLDIFTSVWDSPDIAHLIVSFGFEGGQHIAFSVEIRREKGEAFSTIGGFFRQFELVLIAATERDVVKLRTNFRKEDVHLYPIRLDSARRQKLFLEFLALGNDLAAEPRFYNTITANCTSVVFLLVRSFVPSLPLDRRIILSGRLPEYLDELGALQGDMPMAERRKAAAITEWAQGILPGQDYSVFIRAR